METAEVLAETMEELRKTAVMLRLAVYGCPSDGGKLTTNLSESELEIARRLIQKYGSGLYPSGPDGS